VEKGTRYVVELEQQWLELNTDLERLCVGILKRVAVPTSPPLEVAVRILRGFLLKAQRTLKGVNVLVAEELWEQGEALTRVLFELRISFDFFVEMFRRDPAAAIVRVLDAMLLEKFRQVEASGIFGHGLDLGDWERKVAGIRGRYTAQEFNRLRRYGFSGLSLEQRATSTGHVEAYQIVYRNFSRNIHSTDYAEHIGDGVVPGDRHDSYLHSRNIVILYVAYMAAAGIAEQVNAVLNCHQEKAIEELALRHTTLKNASSDAGFLG